MIRAMRAHRLWLVGPAAVLVAATACSSTTPGSGHQLSTGASSTTAPASSPPATTAGPTASSAAPSPTVSVQPAPSSPVHVATVHIGTTTYVISVWSQTTDVNCVAHAYGAPVIAYLTAHPCHGMTRLLATTAVNGKPVGFNQSSISFEGDAPAVYQDAGDFRTLVLQDGTGSLNDLLREGHRLPSGPTAVPSPDAFEALSQDAGVTIYDMWYLSGPTPNNDPALIKMAQDIYLQY